MKALHKEKSIGNIESRLPHTEKQALTDLKGYLREVNEITKLVYEGKPMNDKISERLKKIGGEILRIQSTNKGLEKTFRNVFADINSKLNNISHRIQ